MGNELLPELEFRLLQVLRNGIDLQDVDLPVVLRTFMQEFDKGVHSEVAIRDCLSGILRIAANHKVLSKFVEKFLAEEAFELIRSELQRMRELKKSRHLTESERQFVLVDLRNLLESVRALFVPQ